MRRRMHARGRPSSAARIPGDLYAAGSCVLEWLNIAGPASFCAGQELPFAPALSLAWPSQAPARSEDGCCSFEIVGDGGEPGL